MNIGPTWDYCPYCNQLAEVTWLKFGNGSKIKTILCPCMPKDRIVFVQKRPIYAETTGAIWSDE